MGDPDFLKHVIKTTRKRINKLTKRVTWLDQTAAQRSHDELHAYLQEYVKLEKTIDQAKEASDRNTLLCCEKVLTLVSRKLYDSEVWLTLSRIQYLQRTAKFSPSSAFSIVQSVQKSVESEEKERAVECQPVAKSIP
jgi:transketolase